MKLKELRKNTYLALMMVVVAALALATATYAWFVSSSRVEVEQMNFTAETSTSLFIAVHVDGATTVNQEPLKYKSFLEKSELAVYFRPMEEKNGGKLMPVSTVTTEAFFTDAFEKEDGKTKGFEPTSAEDGYFLALPVWFNASQELEVYLSEGSGVTVEMPTGANATSVYLDRCLRVAFTSQDDAGALLAVEGAVNPVIYEPNPATDAAISIPPLNRRNTTAYVSATEYSGVVSAGPPPVFVEQTLYTGDHLFVTYEGNETPTENDVDLMGKVPVVRLDGNQAQKVTIYVWLEGMDFDCVDGITGSTLNVKLKFIGVKPVTP